MIKILINGCNGKKGQEVMKLIDSNHDFVLICGFDFKNIGNYSFPVYTDISQIEEKPDVVIDFSVPDATMKILSYCKSNGVPIVIATTGLSNEQMTEIKKASKIIPIFKSANMSYDINLMASILSQLAVKLQNTDIEIIETHHNRKIDSPSGTALFLADSINQALGNTKTYEFDRHHKHEKRSKDEIGFSSVRGGNIVGEHIVQFYGENETFEIKHTCYSRTVFAEGALKAAQFLFQQENGFYNMNDLIESNQ